MRSMRAESTPDLGPGNAAAEALVGRQIDGQHPLVTTLYSHAIRVLACQGCGAPFDAALAGGQIQCSYCSATNVVHRRDESADRTRAQEALRAPIGESERHAQLRLQDQGPETFPENLTPWLSGSTLNPVHLPRAQEDWQFARQQLASGSQAFNIAERFFYLTILTADHLDPRRQRAALETAAELLTDARHRHVVRCMLARLAAQHGDFEAAEEWLQTCNPRPTDLIMDTAYRNAAATLAVAKNDLSQVFDLLGHRPGDVPFADRQEFACGLLRVHALEASGRLAQATEEVRSWIASFGEPAVRGAVRAHQPLELCRGSLAQASRAMNAAGDEAQLSTLIERRRRVKAGAAAFSAPLARLPIFVFILMIPIVAIRCSADADPLMGVYGYALCPATCDGCEGPTRTVTDWHQIGPGEYSSNGAQYFCQSPEMPLEDMSSGEIEMRISSLAPYELSWTAAAGSTFLILMLLLLPTVPIVGFGRYRRFSRDARRLEAEIGEICLRLGRAPPIFSPTALAARFLSPAAFVVLVPTGIAALMVLLVFL